jgi:hypothetical protein
MKFAITELDIYLIIGEFDSSFTINFNLLELIYFLFCIIQNIMLKTIKPNPQNTKIGL